MNIGKGSTFEVKHYTWVILAAEDELLLSEIALRKFNTTEAPAKESITTNVRANIINPYLAITQPPRNNKMIKSKFKHQKCYISSPKQIMITSKLNFA